MVMDEFLNWQSQNNRDHESLLFELAIDPRNLTLFNKLLAKLIYLANTACVTFA